MTDLVTQTPARADRQKARRRNRRRRRAVAWLLAASVAGAAAFYATRSAREEPGATGPHARLSTTLMAVTVSADPSGQADSLTLFASGPDGSDPIRLFIPSGTLAPIPGQGFEPLSRALGEGDAALLELSVENLLGIRIDRAVAVDDVSLGRFIDELGGVSVEVPETLTVVEDGTSERIATQGTQRMNGATALTYATYRDAEHSELSRFVRMQAVLDAVAALGPSAVGSAARRAEPSEATSDGALDALTQPLAGRADTNHVIPVEAAGGSGAAELYRVDHTRVRTFLTREMPGAMITSEARTRVEIRNGSGLPGVGERAAALLVPEGFAIEVSGNAPTFDERSTKILIYQDTPEARGHAERIRGLLGVGRIELATRAPSVVDLTIVTGQDFPGSSG